MKCLIVLAVLFNINCAHISNEEYKDPSVQLGKIICVAVMPFENGTGFYEAGRIVSELASIELTSAHVFNVMDRKEVENVLYERRIFLGDKTDIHTLREIGRILGVQGIISGSVMEFWYKDIVQRDKEPVVSIKAELVEVRTGKIAWSRSITKTGSIMTGTSGSITALAQDAVSELVERMLEGLPKKTDTWNRICWNNPYSVLKADKTMLINDDRAIKEIKLKSPLQMAVHDLLKKGGTFILDGVKFNQGGSFLNPKAFVVLNDLGEIFKVLKGLVISVDGHSDSQENSVELSQKRAMAVRDYLIRNFQIEPPSIKIKGYGSSKPIAPNFTLIGREKNRRVEVTVLESK